MVSADLSIEPIQSFVPGIYQGLIVHLTSSALTSTATTIQNNFLE